MATDQEVSSTPLGEPRMEDRNTLLVAGLMKEYTPATMNEIPLLWRQLVPHLGKIPGQVGHTSYGVIYNLKNSNDFAYMAGVEVSNATDIPDELNVIRIPDVTYAVFPHTGHVSALKDTIRAIWTEWLPGSGARVVQADEEMPDMLEYYGGAFNPETGMGDMEVWVPIKNRTRVITFDPVPEA